MAALENYANMNATERNVVLKSDLKTIVDEQLAMLNNDPNTIRNEKGPVRIRYHGVDYRRMLLNWKPVQYSE